MMNPTRPVAPLTPASATRALHAAANSVPFELAHEPLSEQAKAEPVTVTCQAVTVGRRATLGRDLLWVMVTAGLLVLLGGCNDGSDGPLDADAGTANAGSADAGAGDSGAMDSGATEHDSGVPDAEADAGVLDAGGADAGAPDAGALDAGLGRDETGCPFPTGATVDAADAGLPSGLVLWLRADVGVATLDGGAVCRWEDVSGHQHHVFPAMANLPRFSPTGLQGKPALLFTYLNHLVRGDVLGLAPTQGRTIAVRAQLSDTTHRFHSILQGQSATPAKYFGIDQNTFGTAGSREGVYVSGNSYDADLATSGMPQVHVYSVSSLVVGTVLPAALVYAIDGVPRTLSARAGSVNRVADFSGANFTAVGYGPQAGFGAAALGEVMIFDHALTDVERGAVEAHLGW